MKDIKEATLQELLEEAYSRAHIERLRYAVKFRQDGEKEDAERNIALQNVKACLNGCFMELEEVGLY